MKRFWDKVNLRSGVFGLNGQFPTECWEWTAQVADGYGKFRLGDKKIRAHRLAWELAYGSIPFGMAVCHHCDNRKCVRESHLFLGTNLDNVSDRDAKSRQAKGVSHGLSILNEYDIQEIRRLYSLNCTQCDIAAQFHVSQALVSDIVNHRRWKHLV